MQSSIGVVIPDVGESCVGPYLFYGAAIGGRYSYQDKSKYTYGDLQMTFFSEFWCGTSIGYNFSNGQSIPRVKYYGGYLIGGYFKEIEILSENKHTIHFQGIQLGFPVPLIGSHIHP